MRYFLLLMILGGWIIPTVQASEHLKVASIVISKNCLENMNPKTQLKSIDNPECPQIDDTQLIQVTVSNYTGGARKVGVEIIVSVDGKPLEEQPERVVKVVRSLDITRILQSYTIPNHGGTYHVAAKLYDSQFEHVLTESEAGIERHFYVLSADIVKALRAKSEKKKKKVVEKRRPEKLAFDPPDLRWEDIQVVPRHVLRGEKFRARFTMINVGGDIARDVKATVTYYNIRLPRRKTPIAAPSVDILAPGESATFEVEYLLPDDELLGVYQLLATVDPDDRIQELDKDNNKQKSENIHLSDIKLLLPADEFQFAKNGLFFFQWDSLQYNEFKVQIGIESTFEDPTGYFELPQGDRWIADKELVPLAGELPSMAIGLLKTFKKDKVFWRVVGKRTDGKQTYSNIRSFSIQ